MLRVLALAAALFGAPLAVHDGQLRLPPPGGTMTAGYLRLDNPHDVPVTVVGVSVDGASEAMIHETRTENGQASMQMLPKLVVPAHGSVTLAPGGKHLMVSFPKPPAPGQDLGVTVRLEDGRSVKGVLKTVTMPR